jgi:hypothetical protein
MHFVKKIFPSIIIFLTVSVLAWCQQPTGPKPKDPSSNIFYIKIYGGYGILTPGSNFLTASTSSVGGGSNSSFTSSNIGLGAGLHFGGGLGFILNDFLNVGVDAEYLKARDISISSTYANSPYYSSFSQLLTHTVLSIIPNITFKALSKPTYYFYTRIGVVIAVTTNLENTSRDSTFNASGGNTYVYRTDGDQKFAYNINFGAQVAVGIQFRITQMLRGLVEISGNYLPASPSSSTATFKSQYIVNSGAPATVNYNYNYTYSKSGNDNFQSSTNGNTTTASETLPKIIQNINYIGINVGLAIRL